MVYGDGGGGDGCGSAGGQSIRGGLEMDDGSLCSMSCRVRVSAQAVPGFGGSRYVAVPSQDSAESFNP